MDYKIMYDRRKTAKLAAQDRRLNRAEPRLAALFNEMFSAAYGIVAVASGALTGATRS
jgi:hypothetical protein